MVNNKMWFYSIIFVQLVFSTVCFDLEIEGSVRFGKDVLRRFGNEILPLQLDALEGPITKERLLQLMELSEQYEPFEKVHRNRMSKENVDKLTNKDGKVPSILKLGNNIKYKSAIEESKNQSTNIIDDKFRPDLRNQLSTKGALRLKMLAYYIKNHLKSYTDITSIIKNATENYLSSVRVYYKFIIRKPIIYEIDKEFIALDMVETTNKLLMDEAKKLLHAITKRISTDTSGVDMLHLVEKIKNTVSDEKKEQLRHVCQTLDVCRPFPGFCDHTAALLDELLQLNNASFMEIIKEFNKTLAIKYAFFKTITNNIVYDIVSSKLKPALHNTATMREVVSILRAVITQRYKIFKSETSEVKAKTKAVRILFDIIDKAFEVNGDDLNNMEIQNTINGYKQWATGERNDLDLITKKFVYNAIEILNYGWSKGTKEEVRVLTDVIFAGTTENRAVYDYLFKNGSSLIRNKETNIHSDMI